MTLISSNKNVELTDLETHVALCAQRRSMLESRIDSLESKLSRADERAERVRNMLLGGLISFGVGIAGTLFTLLFKYGVLK
jgi:hypothetical protein